MPQPYRHIEVTPSGAGIGADVVIDDLARLDADAARELRLAWLEHQVVRLRGHRLEADQQLAFARWFGEFQISNPLPNPLARTDLPGVGTPEQVRQSVRDERRPQFTVVSNVVEQGVAVGGLGDGELTWHSDMSSFEAPPSATLLQALEVPTQGGRTFFASMERAAAALPEDVLAYWSTLALKHDRIIDAAGYLRPGVERVDDVSLSPGYFHPLVTRHQETGRPVLFLGRRPHAYVAGLPVAESERLLDQIWAHALQPQFQWTQTWQVGDLLIWDNRSVLHRREAFPPDQRRWLRRLVIRGEPVQPYRPQIGGARSA